MSSALNDKANIPDDETLNAVLDESKILWEELKSHIAGAYGNMLTEWKFYGAKAGWTLAVLSGKKRLLNMIPQPGWFQINFVLGEKAAAAAHASDLPFGLKAMIPDSKACVCGYSFTMDMKDKASIGPVIKLLKIKDAK